MKTIVHPWFRPMGRRESRWVGAGWLIVLVGLAMLFMGSGVVPMIGLGVFVIGMGWLVGCAIARRRREREME